MKFKKQTLILKGLYGHAQTHGYFTVQEYIMLEQEGKHCLLVRFQNEMNTTVHEIHFMLKQFNAAGKEIGRIKLHYSDLEIRPGTKYCTEQGIVIDKNCVDCIVQIQYLIGDNIKYIFRKGVVTEHYDPRGYIKKEPVRSKTSYITVRRKNIGGGKFFVWIALLSLVLAFVFLVALIYHAKEIYGSQLLFCENIRGFLQSI